MNIYVCILEDNRYCLFSIYNYIFYINTKKYKIEILYESKIMLIIETIKNNCI